MKLGFESCGTIRLSDKTKALFDEGLPPVKVCILPASLEACYYIFGEELEDIIIPDSLKKVKFNISCFEKVKFPLETQKRLRELGYTGRFAGTRPSNK